MKLFTVLCLVLATASPSFSMELECDGFQRVELDNEPISFISPGYPAMSPPFSRCGLRLTIPANHRLSIECESFDVSCRQGNILTMVREHGRQINCGEEYSFMSNVKEEDRRAFLRFRTRGQAVGGFKCLVMALSDEEPMPPPPPPVTTSTTPSTTTSGEEVSGDGCLCGKKNTVDRIVGGRDVTEHEYPWQAALTSRGSTRVFCGGSLVTDRHVVTAAHCVTAGNTNFDIVLGEHNLRITDDNAVRVRPSRVTVHPNYGNNGNDNDIAVLELATPITFSDVIRPVCLPTQTPQPGTQCEATGWGALSEGGSGANILQTVTVPVISNQQCSQSYGNSITSRMICAGVPEGGKDSCQGDSGGPLSCPINDNYELTGATSFGFGCAREGFPGVYANVQTLSGFVNQQIAGGRTCPRS